MENIYLILVVVLFVLAISDLVVGVSNDAVNFLNSAIGAKAASFKIIMAVAALGVFIGATFSSGMMEVARKSMFNPEHFYFQEIMIIFLRSEEHTSELQSRPHLVCRLLLEKKKKNKPNNITKTYHDL